MSEKSPVLKLQEMATDNSHDVVELLRKALLIATKLKLAEFKMWIEAELDGYNGTELAIPDYRKVVCRVAALNPMRGPIPLFLPPELAEILCNVPIGAPIASIAALQSADANELAVPFSEEQKHALMQGMTGIGGMRSPMPFEPIRTASRNQVSAILEGVRSAVLKWSLKLEEEGILGEGMTFSEKEKEKAAHSTTINIGSIANLQGIVGNVSESTVTQNLKMVTKGNWASLESALKEQGVSPEDLKQLKTAVESDPKPQGKKFGPKVAGWIGGMIAKAAGGAWDIGIDAASGVLTNAISAYYGLGGG